MSVAGIVMMALVRRAHRLEYRSRWAANGVT